MGFFKNMGTVFKDVGKGIIVNTKEFASDMNSIVNMGDKHVQKANEAKHKRDKVVDLTMNYINCRLGRHSNKEQAKMFEDYAKVSIDINMIKNKVDGWFKSEAMDCRMEETITYDVKKLIDSLSITDDVLTTARLALQEKKKQDIARQMEKTHARVAEPKKQEDKPVEKPVQEKKEEVKPVEQPVVTKQEEEKPVTKTEVPKEQGVHKMQLNDYGDMTFNTSTKKEQTEDEKLLEEFNNATDGDVRYKSLGQLFINRAISCGVIKEEESDLCPKLRDIARQINDLVTDVLNINKEDEKTVILEIRNITDSDVAEYCNALYVDVEKAELTTGDPNVVLVGDHAGAYKMHVDEYDTIRTYDGHDEEIDLKVWKATVQRMRFKE